MWCGVWQNQPQLSLRQVCVERDAHMSLVRGQHLASLAHTLQLLTLFKLLISVQGEREYLRKTVASSCLTELVELTPRLSPERGAALLRQSQLRDKQWRQESLQHHPQAASAGEEVNQWEDESAEEMTANYFYLVTLIARGMNGIGLLQQSQDILLNTEFRLPSLDQMSEFLDVSPFWPEEGKPLSMAPAAAWLKMPVCTYGDWAEEEQAPQPLRMYVSSSKQAPTDLIAVIQQVRRVLLAKLAGGQAGQAPHRGGMARGRPVDRSSKKMQDDQALLALERVLNLHVLHLLHDISLRLWALWTRSPAPSPPRPYLDSDTAGAATSDTVQLSAVLSGAFPAMEPLRLPTVKRAQLLLGSSLSLLTICRTQLGARGTSNLHPETLKLYTITGLQQALSLLQCAGDLPARIAKQVVQIVELSASGKGQIDASATGSSSADAFGFLKWTGEVQALSARVSSLLRELQSLVQMQKRETTQEAGQASQTKPASGETLNFLAVMQRREQRVAVDQRREAVVAELRQIRTVQVPRLVAGEPLLQNPKDQKQSANNPTPAKPAGPARRSVAELLLASALNALQELETQHTAFESKCLSACIIMVPASTPASPASQSAALTSAGPAAPTPQAGNAAAAAGASSSSSSVSEAEIEKLSLFLDWKLQLLLCMLQAARAMVEARAKGGEYRSLSVIQRETRRMEDPGERFVDKYMHSWLLPVLHQIFAYKIDEQLRPATAAAAVGGIGPASIYSSATSSAHLINVVASSSVPSLRLEEALLNDGTNRIGSPSKDATWSKIQQATLYHQAQRRLRTMSELQVPDFKMRGAPEALSGQPGGPEMLLDLSLAFRNAINSEYLLHFGWHAFKGAMERISRLQEAVNLELVLSKAGLLSFCWQHGFKVDISLSVSEPSSADLAAVKEMYVPSSVNASLMQLGQYDLASVGLLTPFGQCIPNLAAVLFNRLQESCTSLLGRKEVCLKFDQEAYVTVEEEVMRRLSQMAHLAATNPQANAHLQHVPGARSPGQAAAMVLERAKKEVAERRQAMLAASEETHQLLRLADALLELEASRHLAPTPESTNTPPGLTAPPSLAPATQMHLQNMQLLQAFVAAVRSKAQAQAALRQPAALVRKAAGQRATAESNARTLKRVLEKGTESGAGSLLTSLASELQKQYATQRRQLLARVGKLAPDLARLVFLHSCTLRNVRELVASRCKNPKAHDSVGQKAVQLVKQWAGLRDAIVLLSLAVKNAHPAGASVPSAAAGPAGARDPGTTSAIKIMAAPKNKNSMVKQARGGGVGNTRHKGVVGHVEERGARTAGTELEDAWQRVGNVLLAVQHENVKLGLVSLKTYLSAELSDGPKLAQLSAASDEGKEGAKKGNEASARPDSSGWLEEDMRPEQRNRVGAAALQRVRQKLRGQVGATRKVRLSVVQHVDSLIEEAKNPLNLCLLYEGWAPWV